MQVETFDEQSVGTPFPDCLASAAILVLGAEAGATGERYDSEVRHPELETRRRETRATSSCSTLRTVLSFLEEGKPLIPRFLMKPRKAAKNDFNCPDSRSVVTLEA